jgi:hypothetical protein
MHSQRGSRSRLVLAPGPGGYALTMVDTEPGTPGETPERLTPAEPPERLTPADPPERLTPSDPPERQVPA